jgi:WD40 repeat protein
VFGLKKPDFLARQRALAQLSEYPVSSAWSSDGSCLAIALANGRIRLLWPDHPEVHTDWLAHEAPLQKLCWHPQELLLSTGAQDGRVRHWRCAVTEPPQAEADIDVSSAWIEDLAWRPDGRFLAVAAGKAACIFDRYGKRGSTLDFNASTIAALAWNPRGTELALAGYQGVQLWTGVTSRPQRTTLNWQGSLLNCIWSPDGKVMAAGCQDNAVHFWRVKTRRDAQMSGYPAKPRALAFTNDARWLLTGGSNIITAWEFSDSGPEGKAPTELAYHKDIISTLAVDAGSGHIVAGSRDSVVSLWESPLATLPYYHFAMNAPVVSVQCASLHGVRLLSAIDQSGLAGIWELYVN